MKLTSLLVTYSLAAAVLTAQVVGGGGAGPPRKPGTVAGVVVNSATQAPIKKATVTLHNLPGGYSYTATSDAAGRFLFDNVAPAAYLITASCPGFAFPMSGRRNIFSSPISVAEEQHVTGVAVPLSPLGVISGKVLDDNGNPIPETIVRALQFDYQQGARRLSPRGSATTDDHGEFRIFDLQPGRFYIQAIASPLSYPGPERIHRDRPEAGYASAFYPASTGIAGAAATGVAPGAEITNIDFHLHKVRLYHVRGKAVDTQTQQAFHGVGISALPCSSIPVIYGFQSSADLRPDGTFDLAGFTPGQYCIVVNSTQAGMSRGRQTVNVADRDVDGVVLTVSPSFEVKGVVTMEGSPPDSLRNLRVWLYPTEPAGSTVPNAAVQEDGSFVFEHVVPQVYDLQLGSPVGGAWYLKSIRFGDQDASAGRIDMTSPSGTLALTLASDSGQATVSVQSDGGDPPVNSLVLAVPGDAFAFRRDMLRTSLTNGRGDAYLPALPPGEYTVFAMETSEMNLANIFQSADFRKPFASRGAFLTVHPNGRETASVKLISADEIEQVWNKLP
ncbi:MAG: carboxypeptidase regulatory-like domain-containing protein [Acidobacteriia bacterium]|nr:carboxypeptidase regulatory-like domain-containing protein [Terriglobia bacterium]